MMLELHSTGIDVNPSTRDYIERRLEFALGRFRHQIERVNVRLEDVNGPRGGVDQRCQIRVSLTGRRPLVLAEGLESEIRVSVDQAFDRISRAVARRTDRSMARRRVQGTSVLEATLDGA